MTMLRTRIVPASSEQKGTVCGFQSCDSV